MARFASKLAAALRGAIPQRSRASKVWRSSPGKRTARHQKGWPREIRIPHFSREDDFSQGLFSNMLLLDWERLGYGFRLLQWGRRGRGPKVGPSVPADSLRTLYAYPSLEQPTRLVELRQGESYDGTGGDMQWHSTEERQLELLLSHQAQFYPGGGERDFYHVTKRFTTIAALSPELAELDFWSGVERNYCTAQLLVGCVHLQAILSGVEQSEAVGILEQLLPIEGNSRLVEWHDQIIMDMESRFRTHRL